MFEGVSGTDNSSNRLGLHLAKRSPDGVCSGNVRNRRPPRRRVLAACAKQNAFLSAVPRQRRADCERFAVRRFASNSRMRCVSCYTQTREHSDKLQTALPVKRNLQNPKALSRPRRASRRQNPANLARWRPYLCPAAHACAAKRPQFPSSAGRRRAATEAAYKGPVADHSALEFRVPAVCLLRLLRRR